MQVMPPKKKGRRFLSTERNRGQHNTVNGAKLVLRARPAPPPTPVTDAEPVPEGIQRGEIAAWCFKAGRPPEKEWGGGKGGARARCLIDLKMSIGSRGTITKVFEGVVKWGADYDPMLHNRRGTKRKLQHASSAGTLAMSMTEGGFSLVDTVAHVNDEQKINGGKRVCTETLRLTMLGWDQDTRARPSRAQGNVSAESNWARARFKQTAQFQKQLDVGLRPRPSRGKHPTSGLMAYDPVKQGLPIFPHSVLYLDQKNNFTSIGGGGNGSRKGRKVIRFARDDKGVPTRIADGGQCLPGKLTFKEKFAASIGFAAGVASVKTTAGVVEVRRTELLPYTGTTVVGPEKHETHLMIAATAPRREKKNGQWLPCNKAENPFQARFGAGWRAKLESTGAMTKCTNSLSIWKWLKKEGDRIFTGTTHEGKYQVKIDALKSMWTPGCVEWLKKNRMWARIIKPEKGCNDGTTCAEHATAGMSHELMPLDTSLFAHMMAVLHKHTGSTRHLPTGDPLKFDMSTTKRL